MKKIFIYLVLAGIAALFIGTAWFLYQKSIEKPVVYETAGAFVIDIVKKTVATGKIVPRREVEIKSQVSGVTETLFVEAGLYGGNGCCSDQARSGVGIRR